MAGRLPGRGRSVRERYRRIQRDYGKNLTIQQPVFERVAVGIPVDLPGHAVVSAMRDVTGLGEVIQPIDTAGRVIFHDEHGTGAVSPTGDLRRSGALRNGG